MIPKGLKIGDTFEDGKRLFVVEAVNVDGTYFSRAVEKADARGVEDAAPYKSDSDKQEAHSQVTRKRRTKKQ